jgi:hypothetical protein
MHPDCQMRQPFSERHRWTAGLQDGQGAFTNDGIEKVLEHIPVHEMETSEIELRFRLLRNAHAAPAARILLCGEPASKDHAKGSGNIYPGKLVSLVMRRKRP